MIFGLVLSMNTLATELSEKDARADDQGKRMVDKETGQWPSCDCSIVSREDVIREDDIFLIVISFYACLRLKANRLTGH